jgi:hypothetical protein
MFLKNPNKQSLHLYVHENHFNALKLARTTLELCFSLTSLNLEDMQKRQFNKKILHSTIQKGVHQKQQLYLEDGGSMFLQNGGQNLRD